MLPCRPWKVRFAEVIEDRCCPRVSISHALKLLIEPLNPFDAPNNLVDSLAIANAILERCDDRIGLQFDAYHIARMGLDPVAEVARVLPRVRHVQFAGRNLRGSRVA